MSKLTLPYTKLAFIYDHLMSHVNYKECIENPAAQAARINAFMGGSLDEEAMAAAVEPELYRHKKTK